MFLPVAGYSLSGMPDYTKMSATCVGVISATMIWHPQLLFRFRPKWVDLPVTLFCFIPLATSLAIGLGLYDGLSISFAQCVMWGLPYLIGRITLGNAKGIRDLAFAFFLGGLIYIPLCWIEIRLSPQLHRWVYGFAPSGFANTYRLGGFRPIVFMQHGLMTAMWMCNAYLCGHLLFFTRTTRRIRGFNSGPLLALLAVTVILSRSVGALLLLLSHLFAFHATVFTRFRIIFAALAASPIVWILSRAAGWYPHTFVELISPLGPNRVDSFVVRLQQEDQILNQVSGHMFLGQGTWTLPGLDQVWLIELYAHGLAGLISLCLFMTLPIALMIWRIPARSWSSPFASSVVALGLLTSMYAIDCMYNGMVNPVYAVANGAMCGVLSSSRNTRLMLSG